MTRPRGITSSDFESLHPIKWHSRSSGPILSLSTQIKEVTSGRKRCYWQVHLAQWLLSGQQGAPCLWVMSQLQHALWSLSCLR